jgi:hypothetical protein
MLTLLDIAKLAGNDAVVGLVDEASIPTPELTGRVRFMGKDVVVPNVGSSRTIRGRSYQTLVRTGLPTVGFRNANAGSASSKSTFEQRLFETFILNPRWDCDVAVAKSNEDGAEALLALEGDAVVTAALMALARQFYYGRNAGGDAAGHPGLLDSVDSAMVVDAGGSAANTGSSVWAVTYGPKMLQWVFGEQGSLTMTDVRVESVTDANDATKKYSAYVQEMLAFVGLQVVNKNAIACIKNLTAETNHTLNDAWMGKLAATFPTGYVPDAYFMNRRSLEQLRSSRTATNATGAEAPTPTDYQGVPIIPTDNILSTEAIR